MCRSTYVSDYFVRRFPTSLQCDNDDDDDTPHSHLLHHKASKVSLHFVYLSADPSRRKTSQKILLSRGPWDSPSVWRRPAPRTPTTSWAKSRESWRSTMWNRNRGSITFSSASRGTDGGRTWSSGRWKSASCRDCRWTGCASSVYQAPPWRSRTLLPKYPTIFACDWGRQIQLFKINLVVVVFYFDGLFDVLWQYGWLYNVWYSK